MLERISRFVALLVTNITKLAGLFVGIHAGLAPKPSALTLAFAAFMMAGAQVSETTLLAIIERFFGMSKKE